MPNENKKSYKEIAENNMIPRNTLLKDVYAKLEQIPEADMQARITEIREALIEVNTNTAKMNRRMMSKTRKQQKEDKEGRQALDEIILVGRRLENEAEMLDNFPRVRATVKAIETARADAEMKHQTDEISIHTAKNKLQKAQEEAQKAIEAEKRAQELEAEIAEIKKEMEEAKSKGRKQKVIDAYQEEIDERETEKSSLGKKEDWEKALAEVDVAKANVNLAQINAEKSKALVAKLEKPWETMLKGCTWEEIGELTNEDLSKLAGVEVKKEEARWEEKPAEKEEDKKDRDEDKNSKKSNKVNGQERNEEPTVRTVQPTQREETQPEVEQEQEENEAEQEEEQEQEEEANLPVKWSEKHKIVAKILPPLARWMDESKAREEAFIEKFRQENRGDPSWFQKIKARFSKEKEEVVEETVSEEEKAWKEAKGNLVQINSKIQNIELKLKNYETNARNEIKAIIEKNETKESKEAKANLAENSLQAINSVAAMYIARGDYTKAEIEEMINDRARVEGKQGQEILIEIRPDTGYQDTIKRSIKAQLEHITISQLKEREIFLKGLGVYTDEEFAKIQKDVEEREIAEKATLNANLAQAKGALQPAKEAEEKARKAFEASQVSPSRQAHRDFGARINGEDQSPAPTVENADEGRGTRSNLDRTSSEPDLGDPFEEEPADTDDGAR